MKQPVLSICIPTYNRSEYLVRTIESIVRDPLFGDGEVELVVSDNASTDDTEAVVRAYVERYDNIVYSRNPENVADRNFPIVLSLARGEFCKLYNDTAVFLPGALSDMLECVRANLSERPVLFFANGNCGAKSGTRRFDSADGFFAVASYWATWIGAFGIWKNDFERIPDKFSGTELKLWQTKVLYEMVAERKKALIFDQPLVEIQIVKSKGGYNISEIFARNFLDIVKVHVDSGTVSIRTFRKIKKDLFCNFLVPWYFFVMMKKGLYFDLSGMKNELSVHFSPWSHHILRLCAILYVVPALVKKIRRALGGAVGRWRRD